MIEVIIKTKTLSKVESERVQQFHTSSKIKLNPTRLLVSVDKQTNADFWTALT